MWSKCCFLWLLSDVHVCLCGLFVCTSTMVGPCVWLITKLMMFMWIFDRLSFVCPRPPLPRGLREGGVFSLQFVFAVGAMGQCSYKTMPRGRPGKLVQWCCDWLGIEAFAMPCSQTYSTSMSSGEIATSLLSVLVLSGQSVPAQGLTVDWFWVVGGLKEKNMVLVV